MLNSNIQSNGGDTVSFIKQVAEAMASRGLILNYLETVAPVGKLDGKEFKFKDGSTRSVNIKTGKGVNFDTRSGGAGDVVGVCAYEEQCNQVEAARRLNDRYSLGIDGGGAPSAYGPKAYTRAAGASGAVVHAENRLKNEGEDVCTDISEAELAAGVSTWTSFRNWDGFAFVRSWTYRHADGRAAFVVARYDKEGEKKVFHPWCVVGEKREWRSKHFPKPRPIYNLPALVINPDAVVVVVEGEKCASAGESLKLPGVVFTTWGGGSGTAHIKSAEWTPLAGRRVIVWPDLDETGQKAKQTILGILHEFGAAEVSVIEAPEKPAKWDCAEAVAAGEDVPAILAGAVPCEAPARELPALVLKNEHGLARITDIAKAIASKLAASGEWFRRTEPDSLDVQVRRLMHLQKEKPENAKREHLVCKGVDAKGFNSKVEKHFRIVSETVRNNHRTQVQDRLTTDLSSQVIASDEFSALPEVKGLISAPRLMENGEISEPGYDPVAQVLCTGSVEVKPCESLEDATKMILDLLSGFAFTTPGDKARAHAALLLPALRFGPWQSSREAFPLVFVRANASSAGKGEFVHAVCEVYGETPSMIAQPKGGLGSLSESFSTQLAKNRPHILFDNVRGGFDIPALEAFQTAKTSFQFRGFSCEGNADPRNFFLWITSNGCELTRDQAQRNLQVSITHQGEGHVFKRFSVGGQSLSLQEYIQSQRGVILGAVFRLWQEWMRSGRPQAGTTHRMGAPMAAVNWVVQNLLGLASCDEGHEEASLMSANPFAQFLRNYALACNPSAPKSTTRIMEEATDANVALPDSVVNQEGDTRKKQQMGRLFGTLFKDKEGERESVTLGEFVLTRHDERNGAPNENKNWRYTFTSVAKAKEAPEPSTAPADPVYQTPAPEELATFKREQFTGSRAPDPATVRAAFELHRVNPSDEYERQLCAASLHNLRHGAGADGAEADWEASTVGWSEDRKKQARDFARQAVETVRQSI